MSEKLVIGILALQGAFSEHINLLLKLDNIKEVREIRKKEELEGIDALIIPGGESTTMALVAEASGLMEPLKELIKVKKIPVWGTCAGLIFLSEEAEKVKKGGQKLLGGLHIKTQRNAFGSQIDSFVTNLDIPVIGEPKFRGIFIRAPIIESIGDDVTVLAKLENGSIVAVKQDNIIATAFHPELTNDPRFHQYFINHVIERKVSTY
ncbi:SNO glutamine amidotransferase [Neocallimastix lanati (nom. inval.)]|jgi:5'-phosphate synthase pdxT subunit|uniref:glutaminase n=1 Tax=Neocallimastix californiae TaxID=1754190 RepID=A0A1Y2CGY2_9FUNG|nr:SNO glutamine amidotransferase [Neocallimastix sp. JGI-2020a]ORY46186.1 SNO glutamine amidotransferase [Neocallimastix californiae]|eukprot:ORY46186.1 SNO glutamine amidotransferase [Neocallimastix californiae]